MSSLGTCPKCGQHGNTVFCTKDGAALIGWRHCICGNSLAPTDKFCGACGKRVEKGGHENESRGERVAGDRVPHNGG